jgi:thiol-disulfide isomerase/thioredoxin
MFKSYWLFVVGIALLLVFVVYSLSDGGSGHRSRSSWLGPGGTRRLLGVASEEYASYEGFSDAPATFTMFGVDWCPHCVSTKPEFEKLGATKTIGGKVVQMRYVNPEKDKAAASGYDIQGYPTLILDQGGQRKKYSGERKATAFEKWLTENL